MATSNVFNGVQLFWEMKGSSGEPLVLVHGSWVDHHNWDRVVPVLAQTFRVVSYDRRGHSQSERPGSQGSIHEDAADLAALITELELAPAHIVGSSYGGSVVLRLASKRPELFRSLIVNEPPLMGLLAAQPEGPKMLEAIQQRITAVIELLKAGDAEGGARQFVETIAFGPGAWAQMPPEVKKVATSNAATFLDEMLDPEALSIDLASLRKFSHPALLTRGEQGPPFFPPIIAQLADVLPQVEQKIFTGVGHEPEQDDPDAYIRTVVDFIEKVNGSVRAVSG